MSSFEKQAELPEKETKKSFFEKRAALPKKSPKPDQVEFRKTEGHSTGEGEQFEETTAALVFLRCLREGLDFQLTLNDEDGGVLFDDIVLSWEDKGKVEKEGAVGSTTGDKDSPNSWGLFLQLKYRTGRKKKTIRRQDLMKKKEDFCIRDLYDSYVNIRESLNGGNYALVAYTNCILGEGVKDMFIRHDPKSLPWRKWMTLLESGGCVYKLNPDHDDIKRVLEEGDDRFIKNFYLFCSQCNNESRKGMVCSELQGKLAADESYSKIMCRDLCDGVRCWMNKNEFCLRSDWECWLNIVDTYIKEEVTACNSIVTKIKYRNVKALETHIQDRNPAWIRPPGQGATALSATKVHQIISDEKHIVVSATRFSQLEEKLLCCWGPLCRWLVIVDDRKCSSDDFHELVEKVHNDRHLVIVSSREDNCSKDTCQSCDVSDDTWEDFLDVSVRPNGERYECRLRDLVAGVVDLKELLDGRPTPLLALARLSRPLRMGRELETLPNYYVHRKLLCGQRGRNEFFLTPSDFPAYGGEKELLEVLDAASNVVIVEGKPGVGKSKMMSDVAKQLKDRDPACWVVRVNLWQFDTVLEHSGDSAVEDILNATLANEGDLVRLEYALLESPKVVFLVDGFDEVDPEFEVNCLTVVCLLAKQRKGKLVVTTRPGQVKLLEDWLRVRAHSLEPFSDAELREFLRHRKPGACFTEIRFIGIDLMNLLRIPLFAEMYASVPEGATEATKTYNILTLYEAFIREDFMRLYNEQRRESLSAKGKKKEVDGLLEGHKEQLMILAESTLVRREDLPPVPRFNVTFMKPGIAYELPNGKPAFLHRSFAEYFLARRLVSGGRERSYVAKVYCKAYRDRTLELFLQFFDRTAADGQKLIEAVLDYDLEKFVALLREGVDPRQADTYGRNALHLSCDSGIPVPVLCRNYSGGELKDLLSARDRLLGWTPLRYAAERGDWFVVYWLVTVADCDPSLLGEDFAAQLGDPTQLQALFEREGYRSLYQHVIRVNDSSPHRTENSAQIQVAVSLMSADMPEESVELIAKKALENGHDAVGNLLLLIYCGKPIQDVRPVLATMRSDSLSRKLEEYGWRGWGDTSEPAASGGDVGLLTRETEALFMQESTEELRNWIRLRFSSWALQRSRELGSTSADKLLEELLDSVEIPTNYIYDFWIRGFFVEHLIEITVQKKKFRRSPNSAVL